MAIIKPFKGIRPPQNLVEQVASRPYDVLNSEEARAEAEGNEKSLYHIIKPEIDLRGYTLDEAIMLAERFIDDAVIASFNTVTIIHGKGTGVLRAGIQKMLKTHPNVKEFRLGQYGEGENGVTVVTLKS